MISFGIADLGLFKSGISLLCRTSSTVRFDIDASGIKSVCMDGAMTTFVEMKFKKEMFTDFEISSPDSYYFDSVALMRVMKGLDTDGVRMKIDGSLGFSMSDKKSDKTFEVNQVSKIDSPDYDPDHLVSEYEVDCKIPIAILKDSFGTISNLGSDEVYFIWDANGISLTARKDVMSSFNMKLKDIKFDKLVGSGQTSFKIPLLENFIQMRVNDVRMFMIGTNKPIILSIDNDKIFLRALFAPFVPESGD